jgi:hypothetical protein
LEKRFLRDQNSIAVHPMLVVEAVPPPASRDKSNQYAVPGVSPVITPPMENGITAAAAVLVAETGVPTAVPVWAAAFAGAVPVPNLAATIEPPEAPEFPIVP